MTVKKLAVFILFIVSMQLLFCTVDAQWRRRRWRRRRRSTQLVPREPTPPPPPPTTKAPTTPYCDSSFPRYPELKWLNKWHQSFHFACPDKHSMSQWISVFRLCQEDRIHHMQCRLGPAIFDHSNCYWTPIVNSAKKAFSFKCPSPGFINGIISSFDETSKDRRLRVRCCHVNGYQRFDCRATPYQNQFGALVNFVVEKDYTLVVLTSQYSASLGDRRWKFVYCKVKRTHGKN